MASARQILLRRWVPYAALAACLLFTAAMTVYVLRTTRNADVIRFESVADETQHRVQIRLDTHIELLRAGAALFSASAEVTPPEFTAFAHGLQIRERYPGIDGIFFTASVTDDDPARRAAMERARDTGEPAATSLVTLPGPQAAEPGFLIYLPVYRSALPTDVASRRAAIGGFVYSSFHGIDLFRDIASNRGLGMRIYDGPAQDRARLLHETALAEEPSPYDLLQTTTSLDVAGRPWTLAFDAYQHFAGSARWLAPGVAATGLLVSCILFAIMRSQIVAWEAAARHAAALRSSEEAQRETGERLRRLVILEREARAEAQHADRAKDEFLATLSHELRTPLNAMLGWISMLRSGKVREDRRAQAMEVIDRNARTQVRLIEDLLDVSRIVAGKVRLELQPLQLAPVVRAAVESMRPTADAKGVHLHVDTPHDVPPILGDANRVQQIVWNLVSNAIKFTPPGGHVHADLAYRDGRMRLSVRDTGIGIDPSFLPHVFERFRQADSSSTRAHSGVGLGLAIVHHLVELHGGTIEAQSDGRDQGACFIVYLPVATSAALMQNAERTLQTHGAR